MNIIEPDWPAPPHVRAWTTTRDGGVSKGCYASLNLGIHVGDQTDHVLANRKRLYETFKLPSEPKWLLQEHGIVAVDAAEITPDQKAADIGYTRKSETICAVMTADCLPVLLTDRQGHWVSAVHGGWRGLLSGVLEAAIQQYDGETKELLAWLGPAIGPEVFEVGSEVHSAFINHYPECGSVFTPLSNGKFLLNLYSLARHIFTRLAVCHVYGGEYCTYTESERFFSYRRDGTSGRMASLIWMAE